VDEEDEMSNQPVVVGVGGSARASEAAVRYGAEQAQVLGTGLRLVHVVPAYVPVAPMLPMPPEDFQETGREVVAEFAELARTLVPADRLSTVVPIGSRSAELVAAAAHAPMLVLGHEEHPVLDRLLVGTTVAGVAAHAEVPVVVVPGEWTPQEQRHCVVVGIKSVEHAAPLVRRALEFAARRGDRVVLLHAWELQGQYDDIITGRVDLEEVSAHAGSALEEALAPIREAWPDVPVEIRVVHGQPARVLRDASRECDLLLLAKRPHAFPAGHLGSTGRVLLRESACPVEVVPPGEVEPPEIDLELERDGVLRK
jgi:nucleotide-binding universal stress UspA family protein